MGLKRRTLKFVLGFLPLLMLFSFIFLWNWINKVVMSPHPLQRPISTDFPSGRSEFKHDDQETGSTSRRGISHAGTGVGSSSSPGTATFNPPSRVVTPPPLPAPAKTKGKDGDITHIGLVARQIKLKELTGLT